MSVIGPRELLHYWPYTHLPNYKTMVSGKACRGNSGRMHVETKDGKETTTPEHPWPKKLYWSITFETMDRPGLYHFETQYIETYGKLKKLAFSFNTFWTRGQTFAKTRKVTALLQLRIKGYLIDSWLMQDADMKFTGPGSVVLNYRRMVKCVGFAPPHIKFTISRSTTTSGNAVFGWYHFDPDGVVSAFIGEINEAESLSHVHKICTECEKDYRAFFLALIKKPGQVYVAVNDKYII